MKNQILDDAVDRQRAAEAVHQAAREWQSKCELPAPAGFLRPRASSPDIFPPDKSEWLRQRVAEILESEK